MILGLLLAPGLPLFGTRGCCVFSAPLRAMLACTTHYEACALGERVHGKGISIQSWGIVPKIREVDDYLSPAEQSRIREGHPEVSFATMNGGNALAQHKSTSAGRDARLRLLEAHFPGVPEEVEKHRAFRSDVIDAFALLWTARRLRDGIAALFPVRLFTTPADWLCRSGPDFPLPRRNFGGVTGCTSPFA